MTKEESTVVTYHLDQLETLLDAREDADGLMHLGAVQKILGASHGAQSHAGPKRGRRKKAEVSATTPFSPEELAKIRATSPVIGTK